MGVLVTVWEYSWLVYKTITAKSEVFIAALVEILTSRKDKQKRFKYSNQMIH
jgi:hypothetical protein